MKKQLLILALVVFIACCKKKEQIPPPITSGSSLLIKRIVHLVESQYMAGYYEDYYYNQDSMITEIWPYGIKGTTYTYSGDTIMVNKAGPGYEYYFLNGAGLADSLVRSSSTCTVVYQYDGQGYRLRAANYCDTGATYISDYKVSNGNIISVLSQSSIFQKLDYEYDLTHVNSIGNKNRGLGFLGRSSENLEKRITVTDNNGNRIRIHKNSYQFDSLGRVSTAAFYYFIYIDSSDGGLIDSVNYYYY